MIDDITMKVCPIKNPRGLVYPWKSNDDGDADYDRNLPPLGWNRGIYGGVDPRLVSSTSKNMNRFNLQG